MSTATADDVANVLRLLGGAFPTFPLDEVTLETYVRSLAAEPLDASTLNAAAVAWVATQDRYPTVHQLREAYLAEARRRLQARADAEAERIMRAGCLPGVGFDPGYSVEMLDVLRSALAQVGTGRSVHRHPGGDASLCPTCSTADQHAAAVAHAAGQLVEARGLRPPATVETFACRECLDVGYVPDRSDGDRVVPCMGCQPVLYQRWNDGHLRPGHTCAECRGQG